MYMGRKPSLLLSFVGTNDPYGREDKAPTGGTPYGPIISAVNIGDFDNIVLLTTPSIVDKAENTKKIIEELYPDKKVTIHHTNINDPTNHAEIINAINKFVEKENELLFQKNYEIFISVTSGTPAIHACWLLVTASGKIPAKIIHVKERKYTPSGKPEITQIDLTKPEFPVISPKITVHWEKEDTLPESFYDYGLIGNSQNFIKACQQAWNYARENVDILLLGETGTGKELFAKMIHKVSGRKGEFVPFHCAGTTENIFESELFGHKKGAFTGAISNRDGRCKTAQNGTLFFDEIGDVPLSLQVKLLRFLEDKKYSPVGSDKEEEADVRFVFATNKNLEELVKEGKMREDFYYRIRGVKVIIPPLRERITDIHLLIEYFVTKFDNKTPKVQITPEAMQKLTKYNWPGNIRELEKTIKEAIINSGDQRIITPDIISFSPSIKDSEEYLQYLPTLYEGFQLDSLKNEIHDFYIRKALEMTKGNQSQAAKLLGITPQAISQYLKKEN